MKQWIISITIFLSLSIVLGYSQQTSSDNDDYGKVQVQVIDAETQEPVNEPFDVSFFEAKDEILPGRKFLTNENGLLILEVLPGSYYLRFSPLSPISKFETDPSPFLVKTENTSFLNVEKGKITEFVKKAYYGGSIKVMIVDQEGNIVNFKKLYGNDSRVSIEISSSDNLIGTYSLGESAMAEKWMHHTDDITDGEMVISRLFPGKYNIYLSLGVTGYKAISIGDIKVTRNQTVLKKILFDTNIPTSLEGYIHDQKGNPLKGLFVSIGSSSCLTNSEGHYKIFGMSEGEHLLSIGDDLCAPFTEDGLGIQSSKYVLIKKDHNQIMNFVINIE